MSIPGMILIYNWGGLLDEQWSGEFNYLINLNTIPKTLLVIFSLIGFYSMPFIIIFNLNIFNLIKKNFFKFFVSLTICSLTYFFFNINIFELDTSKPYPYGQGFVSNISYKFTGVEESYLVFSALGLLMINYIYQISLNNKILILSVLSIFSLRVHFFTEYLDPLIFVLLFTLLDLGNKQITINSKNIIILQSFFSAILIGAILI